MRRRFVIAGTLLGGVLLSFLNWLTAPLLPPRYKQFRDPGAVVETIRANVSGNDRSRYAPVRPEVLKTLALV
jgi:hypothetical protein